MRRKGLATSVRSVIEGLESRMLFNSVAVGTGMSSIVGVVQTDPVPAMNGFPAQAPVPIAGATVYIDENNDNTLDAGDPNTITDAMGNFAFTQIASVNPVTNAPILYKIEVIAQPGFQQDAPGYVDLILPNNGLANTQAIMIGESNATGISGILFNDLNQDGQYEPETESPLAGDTVYVDANGNGQFDPGEVSTTTGLDGRFTLPEPPGTYLVRVVPRPGFHQDPPGVVMVTLGNSDEAIANIGESAFGGIGGTVFLDQNGNGVQDAGEVGVAGETVNLLDDGNTIESATTDANGLYFLPTLDPGQYQIDVISSQSNGLVEDTPGYVDVTLAQGQTLIVPLGEGAPGSFSGVVFDDKNGNGIQDAGELGQANQSVFLDENPNGILDGAGTLDANGEPLLADEPNAVTDANGNFTIPDLGPGTYTARLVEPQGAVPTAPANASNSFTFTLVSGQALTNQNFGFKSPDLAITTITVPTLPVFGNVQQRGVFRITNVGSLPAIGTSEIQLYDSTVAAFAVGTATTIQTTLPVPLKLKPGQSKVFKVPYDFPATQATGLYYVTAQVVSTVHDNNSTNDFSSPVGPIPVTQPTLDLGLAYAVQPPADVAPGDKTVLSLVVTNNGNVVTTGSLNFRVYIALTNILEPDDIVTQSFIISKAKIKPGASKVFRLVLINPGVNVGLRFPLVYVDSGEAIGETNLANNLATPLAATLFK